MRKRIFEIVALLMWLAFTIPVQAEPESDAIDALLGQLGALMDIQEEINMGLANCCNAANAFFQEGSYASLVRARLACGGTLEKLQGFEAPYLTLDSDVLLSLMRMNVETIGLEDKARALENALVEDASRMRSLEGYLYSGAIHLKDGRMIGASLTAGMEKSLSLDARFDCLWMNDLLLPLADDDRIMDFWARAPERWPLTAGQRQPWIADAAILTEKGMAVLEEIEQTLDDAYALSGMNSLYVQEYAQGGANPEAELLPIDGMPAAYPLPDFWESAEGREIYANEGDPAGNELPEALIWRFSGVAADQFRAYVRLLSDRGLSGQPEAAEDGGWKAAMRGEDRTLLLIWREEGVMLAAYDPRALTLELA